MNPQKRCNELWRKALLLGITQVAIQGQLLGTILTLIKVFQKQGVSGNPEQTKQPSAPKYPVNNPFRPLKEELQTLKPKKKLSPGWQLGLFVWRIETYQWDNTDSPHIYFPIGPQRQLVNFLIDTEAQMSIISSLDA